MLCPKTRHFICIVSVLPAAIGTGLYWELTYDGVVSHPGRVNDSHMLCKTESGDKHLLYAPSMLYFMAQRRIKLILLHSKSYNKNLRHYLRKTTLLLVVSIVIGKESLKEAGLEVERCHSNLGQNWSYYCPKPLCSLLEFVNISGL